MFFVYMLPREIFLPMAKNRSKEDSHSKWGSECLDSKTGYLVQLCLWAHGCHNNNDNDDSISYRLLSTYYVSGT